MYRSTLAGILLALVGFIAGMQIPAYSSATSDRSDISWTLVNTAVRVELLHRLLIGEVSSVKESVAKDIAFDVKALAVPTNSEELSTEEMVRLERLLVLLAIMQEEMNVGQWREEPEFLKRLDAAAKAYPDLAQQFRCKDWSKPMWVSDDCA
ncbi:MAG: hypothetical protein ABJ322_07120 [Marinobacter sp.]|uniref:hypothetical protein n=1 Tax=Marinobacter sp. TaxID=50741 RepID=UPI003299E0A6